MTMIRKWLSCERPFKCSTQLNRLVCLFEKKIYWLTVTKLFQGFIETIKISTILNTMGQLFDEAELQALIDEQDPEASHKVNFDGFCNIASHFLEEEDDEAMQQLVQLMTKKII